MTLGAWQNECSRELYVVPGSYYALVRPESGREHMEHGIYWIWRDVTRGKAPDNYMTVDGTTFYNIMDNKALRRYYIRLAGEQPSETIYLETTREDHAQWETERERERYRTRCWQGIEQISLETPIRGTGDAGDMTIADQLVDEHSLEEVHEELRFAAFMAELLADWSEEDRFIAEHRFLDREPISYGELADLLQNSLSTTHKKVSRVQQLLLEAMREFDPELTARYETGY